MVNRFQHGSLVMQLPDSETTKIPTVLFGTILGIIGVIASLPRQQFQFLEKLQVCIVSTALCVCALHLHKVTCGTTWHSWVGGHCCVARQIEGVLG